MLQVGRFSLRCIAEVYSSCCGVKSEGTDLDTLKIKRALFGFFPTFKDSPLQPAFNRVLQIGDASGLQSPLSFGGFGSLLRHLNRLTDGLVEALEVGAVDRASLGLINSYNPGLSGSWMMQKAMSVRKDSPPDFVNTLLSNNFGAMEYLGDWAMKPFLQVGQSSIPKLCAITNCASSTLFWFITIKFYPLYFESLPVGRMYLNFGL